jgi:hypothetical protein
MLAGSQAEVSDELMGMGEAGEVANLGDDGRSKHRADSFDRLQSL